MAKVPKYKSLMDLTPWSPSEGKTGCVKPGAPMDLHLERFENDRALRADHKMSCCDCGYRHRYTYEVYVHHEEGKENSWWLKVRAYGDDETHPVKVKRSRLAPKPVPPKKKR